MDKIKTILDREPLSSDYIRSRQDFETVVKAAKVAQKPIWKSAWFYGVTGLSAIAIVIAISVSKEKDQSKEPEVIGEINNPAKDKASAPKVKSSDSGNYSMAFGNPVESKPKVVERSKTLDTKEREPAISPITNSKEEILDEPTPELASVDSKEEKPEATASNNWMPNFGGVYEGNVPVEMLCGGNGIQSNGKLAVTSFTISYYDGRQDVSKRVRGNKIPTDVCEDLGRYNVGTEVFITNIFAEDRFSGATSHLPSMLITPVLGGK